MNNKNETETEISNHNCVIDFNVDDMNPQHIPYFLKKVINAGASEAFVIPIIMKKGRPGFLFKIVYNEMAEEKILGVIFSESTTIGVRKTTTEGVKLQRTLTSMETSLGKIAVKVIHYPSGKRRVIPENDECQRIAECKNLPLRYVQEFLSAELNSKEETNLF